MKKWHEQFAKISGPGRQKEIILLLPENFSVISSNGILFA